MLRRLDEIEDSGGEGVSVYLPPGLSGEQVRELLETALPAEVDALPIAEAAAGSATGAVIFRDSSRTLLVRPPFPLEERYTSPGGDVEPLRSLLLHDFTIALVLVRMGSFAVGVCRGEQIVASKMGTGLVHARHKKGGSSQRRFERHREAQAHHFLVRVCGHARQIIEPHLPALDYIVFGGAWTTVLSLQKECPFLRRFEDRTLPPLLTIADPRRAVLETAGKDAWSSTVIEWPGDVS